MTRATRSAFGTPAGGGGTSGADHCAREGCERRIDITQHPNTASNAEESDTMFVKLTQETLAMMGRLGTITQDTLNRVRNLGRGHDNFIPIDLRNRLDADADQADRNGDRACAAILRQMAAYTGTNAPQPARDLGVSACTNRYAAARELMQLVVAAEEEVKRRRPQP